MCNKYMITLVERAKVNFYGSLKIDIKDNEAKVNFLPLWRGMYRYKEASGN